MKNSIKNIIFDLGGVILNIDYKLTQEAFVKLGLKNIDDVYGQYFQVKFFDLFDRGEISEDEFIDLSKDLFPENTSKQQLVDAWNAMLLDMPEHRFDFLKKIGKKYRIFLMSNTNITHYDEYQKYIKDKYKINGLDDLFEKAYYSFLVGMRKPEDRFFNLILEENNLKANETLFIDDTSINTDAAKTLGLQALWLKDNMDIIEALSEL